jgi:hypothetical protein
MGMSIRQISTQAAPLPSGSGREGAGGEPMLTPANAWRILRRRTGGTVGRSTFYRWLSSGKIYSIRLGFRIYIPFHALEDLIKMVLAGDRF